LPPPPPPPPLSRYTTVGSVAIPLSASQPTVGTYNPGRHHPIEFHFVNVARGREIPHTWEHLLSKLTYVLYCPVLVSRRSIALPAAHWRSPSSPLTPLPLCYIAN
ncbi:uncharacterized protein EV422DRAFT_558770, partial [Fimicolochytrium jonesii]|uniref:uncharacterized protein n=1 Tax=Fimicolochytrium jonesii TaxID=1396493 RepID=UPI0022FED4BE